MADKIKLAVIMDPIESIKIHKDSTFAMLLEAQRRRWHIHYVIPGSLFIVEGQVYCQASSLSVQDDAEGWFQLDNCKDVALSEFHIILMRKDPPFDMEYIYTTYALELAKQQGVCIVNDPTSLRNMNEKFIITHFPQCCAPTLITRDLSRINAFIDQQVDVVVKPLEGMGGQSIFRITLNDVNKNTILEQVSNHGKSTIMVQKFIPEISDGDKRILIVNGEPIPYALARIPKEGELRGNLAAGGSAKGVPLSAKDRWICTEIKESLVQNGILFAGIDVIGSHLTEINITSPTCIRELDSLYELNICETLFDGIEQLPSRHE